MMLADRARGALGALVLARGQALRHRAEVHVEVHQIRVHVQGHQDVKAKLGI